MSARRPTDTIPLPLPDSLRAGFEAFARTLNVVAKADLAWTPTAGPPPANPELAPVEVTGVKILVPNYERMLQTRAALLRGYQTSLLRDDTIDPMAGATRGSTVLVHDPDAPTTSVPVRIVLSEIDRYVTTAIGARDGQRETQIIAAAQSAFPPRAPSPPEQHELQFIAARTERAIDHILIVHNLQNPTCQIPLRDSAQRRAQVIYRARQLDDWMTGRLTGSIPSDAQLAAVSPDLADLRRTVHGQAITSAFGPYALDHGVTDRVLPPHAHNTAAQRSETEQRLLSIAIDEHKRAVAHAAALAQLNPEHSRNLALARLHRMAPEPAGLLNKPDPGVRLIGAARLISAMRRIDTIDQSLASVNTGDPNMIDTLPAARDELRRNLAPHLPSNQIDGAVRHIEAAIANPAARLDSATIANAVLPPTTAGPATMTKLLGMLSGDTGPTPSQQVATAIEGFALHHESALYKQAYVSALVRERNQILATCKGAISTNEGRTTFTAHVARDIHNTIATAQTPGAGLATSFERTLLQAVTAGTANERWFPPLEPILATTRAHAAAHVATPVAC